ncbi:NAD-dependent epimerase/dehydratase family protein [Streptomyces fagopyri]|uniref:NAD-dependent epimerase/dehydratase family protein n=1 Tax=Streptomyces fagopyri TaxID=2662397 RepID=UPI0033C1F53F
MRVVVAGATGMVGSRTVARLRDHGVEVVPPSVRDGVDAATDPGLDRALRAADVVVDATDAASPAEQGGLHFCRSATIGLLTVAKTAEVEQHVVLPEVGAERTPPVCFRAKLRLKKQVRRSRSPTGPVA